MDRDIAHAGVLFVDDETKILKALSRLFRAEQVAVFTAASADEALHVLKNEDIHVVVSDQHMPGQKGVELLARVREQDPDVVRILLTGYAEVNVAVEAINRGEIYRLLLKPWSDDELRLTVRDAVQVYSMRREIDRLNGVTREQNESLQSVNTELQETNRTLEVKVRERTKEVDEKHQELRTAYVDTVRALAEAVDAKDAYTRGHSERVGVYSSRIAREIGCKARFIERIYLAGLLHDIGKIGTPDAILGKPGKLDPEEYEIMKAHPDIGARILEPVRFLSDIVPCVRHHHEWYDGSDRGYPDRLMRTKIPFPSRIILVADTVEAMTADRPYRKALPIERVIEELCIFRGSQFDPTVVEAALSLLEREEEDFIEHASKFDIESFLLDVEGSS